MLIVDVYRSGTNVHYRRQYSRCRLKKSLTYIVHSSSIYEKQSGCPLLGSSPCTCSEVLVEVSLLYFCANEPMNELTNPAKNHHHGDALSLALRCFFFCLLLLLARGRRNGARRPSSMPGSALHERSLRHRPLPTTTSCSKHNTVNHGLTSEGGTGNR